jgi:serine/threonine-protein kinase HipA
MCADAWEGITRNLAQKIAGKNRGEHFKRRHWQRFAEDCGLNPTRVVARVRSLAKLVLAQASAAEDAVKRMPAGNHGLLPSFREAIERRANAVLAGLDDDSGAEEETPPEPAVPRKRAKRSPKAAAS